MINQAGKPLNFVLIGRSGSGKGTQADLIIKKYPNTKYISTGDLFRDLSNKDTQVGHRVKEILDKGGLPYDDLATTLWMHSVAYGVREEEGIMFDGAPRRLDEARDLDKLLEWLGRTDKTAFILVDISREEAFARLSKRRICIKCGKLIPFIDEYKEWRNCRECGGELVERPDDVPESINGRLDFFEKNVEPVVSHYDKKGVLIRIDGQRSISEVFDSINVALFKRFGE